MKNCILLAAVVCLISSTTVAVEKKEPVKEKGRKVTVSLDSPATNYAIKIRSVYQVGNELWVISKIYSKGIGGSAITNINDTVKIPADKKLTIKHKVFGKTWNWGKDTKQLSYLNDREKLNKQIKKQKGKLLYQIKKAKEK